jgi:sugar lactone lactonase YvrE
MACAIAFLLAAGACATRARLPGPASVRVWPPAPERARIELLGEFGGPRDLGIRRTAGRGLVSLLTGTETGQLEHPYSIAAYGDVEGTGPGGREARGPARLAVADTGTKVVHLFDLERGRHRVLARYAGQRHLESPVAVAFDASGRLYVCDSAQRLVLRYDAAGAFDRILSRSFARPAGLAIDRTRGVVYVADAVEHVVRRLDLDGKPGGDVPIPFRFPTHLAVDGEGRLVVSDAMNFRVVVLAADGRPLATVGRSGDATGNLQRPKGVALDTEGHLYVVDALFDNVQIFDLRGRLLLTFGSAGGGPGELALPAGLVIDERNLIYVADTYNGRIQLFRFLGGDE